jgi:hypothetical protein
MNAFVDDLKKTIRLIQLLGWGGTLSLGFARRSFGATLVPVAASPPGADVTADMAGGPRRANRRRAALHTLGGLI